MHETISISQFKATCLALLNRVNKTGQPILVTRRGEPIAMVVAPPPAERPTSWLGSLKSTAKITGNIVATIADPRR